MKFEASGIKLKHFDFHGEEKCESFWEVASPSLTYDSNFSRGFTDQVEAKIVVEGKTRYIFCGKKGEIILTDENQKFQFSNGIDFNDIQNHANIKSKELIWNSSSSDFELSGGVEGRIQNLIRFSSDNLLIKGHPNKNRNKIHANFDNDVQSPNVQNVMHINRGETLSVKLDGIINDRKDEVGSRSKSNGPKLTIESKEFKSSQKMFVKKKIRQKSRSFLRKNKNCIETSSKAFLIETGLGNSEPNLFEISQTTCFERKLSWKFLLFRTYLQHFPSICTRFLANFWNSNIRKNENCKLQKWNNLNIIWKTNRKIFFPLRKSTALNDLENFKNFNTDECKDTNWNNQQPSLNLIIKDGMKWDIEKKIIHINGYFDLLCPSKSIHINANQGMINLGSNEIKLSENVYIHYKNLKFNTSSLKWMMIGTNQDQKNLQNSLFQHPMGQNKEKSTGGNPRLLKPLGNHGRLHLNFSKKNHKMCDTLCLLEKMALNYAFLFLGKLFLKNPPIPGKEKREKQTLDKFAILENSEVKGENISFSPSFNLDGIILAENGGNFWNT